MDIFALLVAVVAVVISLVFLYVAYMSKDFRMFKKMGIPALSPWPAFGNFLEISKIGFFEFHQHYYKEFSTEKVYGFYEPGTPVMVVRDLDMIKDITIKNFNSFVNRRVITREKPFASMMSTLEGERWRYVRNTVSPTFTSGKLRRMCTLVEQSAQGLLDNMKEACVRGEDVELKDMVSCYTMDVIASTGFGVNINSLKDRDCQFAKEAKNIMNISGKTVAFAFLFPPIVKLINKLGFGIFPKKSVNFINDFVEATKQNRKEIAGLSAKRHDFMQLVINEELKDHDLNKSSEDGDKPKKGLSLVEIQGQAMIFILAGYDAVSNVLSFALFVLANRPDICRKLQEEVDSALQGKFPTYETVQSLTFLDMCVNETLRLYPPGVITDRVCTEECVVQGVRIPKGMLIIIPVIAIHKDETYFPDPETFDPERFSPENKANLHPYAHLPFGLGPRNCIGMRLALMEMKIALAAILQEMTPVPCSKTVYPPRLSKFRLKAEDQLWVKLTARKND